LALPDELRLTLAFAIGFGAALVTVPLAIRVAWRTDFLDRPVGYKKHARPTPYLGGVAVMLAFLPASLLLGGGASQFGVIVVCALGLSLVGAVDDRVGLGPLPRVLAEVAAATALWSAGLAWYVSESETVNLLVAIFWVVGVVNAFNLMDNLDGAAGTVGAVSAAGAGVLATVEGDPLLGALALSLAGACGGFLPFNLARPARVFLGDGGSMPIGFVIAAVVMGISAYSGLGQAVVVAAALFVGLPALDTALVVISRTRRGAAVLSGARDHLTHRMLRPLGTPRAVALVLGLTQAALCLVGLLLFQAAVAAVFAFGAMYFLLGCGVILVLDSSYGPDATPAVAAAARRESGPDGGGDW
jgi:UDP-GlcNAc:undecaprenyl-phosphate/decaprenyl-phosphate GlcNAc-1-phosphate transferase